MTAREKRKVNTTPWDPADYLETPEDALAYLNATLEESDDVALVIAALGDIARSHSMTKIARATGLGRESLYKALREDANPSFRTINKVIHALGGRLAILPVTGEGFDAGEWSETERLAS